MEKFWIEIMYKDDSSFSFYVEIESSSSTCAAELEIITRGTLMASNGCRATCYNSDGFDVCSYIK